ncbi:MAG: FmdB family zinc ribbon protein [Acidimicrobiales bacterium]
MLTPQPTVRGTPRSALPTYEYRCKDCSHTFDAVQAFADDALTECPVCSGTLRKLFGNVGISFKGSGFYRTDSRSGSSESGSSNGDSGKERSGDAKGASEKESSKKDGGSDTSTSAKPKADAGSKSDSGSGSSSSSKPGSAPAASAPA